MVFFEESVEHCAQTLHPLEWVLASDSYCVAGVGQRDHQIGKQLVLREVRGFLHSFIRRETNHFHPKAVVCPLVVAGVIERCKKSDQKLPAVLYDFEAVVVVELILSHASELIGNA